MNTHDLIVYEELTLMRRRFPHVVPLPWQGVTQQIKVNEWCVQNVGERGTCWEWILSDQYAFQHEHDAALFNLTWSGS